MKHILLIIVLLSNFIGAQYDQNTPQPQINNTTITAYDMRALQGPATPVKPTDLLSQATPIKPSSIWAQPLIIDNNNPEFNNKSVFKFEDNILYKPSAQYTYPIAYNSYPAAIIIAKDNVTIDLAGFSLSLDPSSASNFLTNNPIYGISVVPGVKNVKIISSSSLEQKGSIFGFSGFAIYIYGMTQSYNTYDVYSNMVKNIVINNLLITQNINGIYILNSLEASISNTNIIYNYSPRPLFGIYYSNVLNGHITSCRINQNFTFSDVCGIALQDTINITVQNCETNANRSVKNGNATGILITGSSSSSSSANELLNCHATRNLCAYLTGKKSIGFSINNGSFHNVIENCRAALCSHSPSYAGTPAPTIPPQGIGFQLNGANSNQVFNNQAAYNDTYGFADSLLPSTSFWTKNMAILNILANYHVTLPSGSGTEPLPTLVLYLNDLDGFTGAGPQLVNIEVKVTA